MSIIIKGMDRAMAESLLVKYPYYLDEIIEIPTPHGRLVEEHYPGELKAKSAEGILILFRSADEDADRFILEEEK